MTTDWRLHELLKPLNCKPGDEPEIKNHISVIYKDKLVKVPLPDGALVSTCLTGDNPTQEIERLRGALQDAINFMKDAKRVSIKSRGYQLENEFFGRSSE